MKAESYMLSDNEFLSATEMFITEQFDRGARRLVDLDGFERASYVQEPPTDFEPVDILKQCDEFCDSHNKNDWWVFEVWCMNEFCGLIAFADWS